MNDKQIRDILVAFLKVHYSEMRIYHEKSIGGATCDLMMVTPKCLTGFEIKSDLDNYQRLDSQIKYYERFFTYNYIVVGTRHAGSIGNRVPDTWGILVVDKDSIKVMRQAQYNDDRSPVSQLSILWKLELKNILNYFHLPMYALRDKDYIITKLVENVPADQLSRQTAYELLNRDYSVYDAEDYTEHYRAETPNVGIDHLMELVDNASEMNMEEMTLDQWIDVYRKAKEIRQKKAEVEEELSRKREPHKIKYTDIEVAPGVPWVDKNIIRDFIFHISGNCFSRPVNYEPVTSNWFIENKRDGDNVTEFVTTYGLRDYNALYILECLLNLREIKRYDSRNRYDEKSTLAAIEKQEIILQEFKDWVWQDEDRIWQIEEAYNIMFGNLEKERYDGSKLEFKDLKSDIQLFDYQKDAIQRIITEKNTLLAFDVGAGKTYIMIAAAMYMRQHGMSRKNMFVVPNSIVGQWEKLFTDLYPMAKLLVVEPRSFKAPVREKTLRNMKEGDYDGIIIAYSCFDMIPLSAHVIADMLDMNIRRLNDAIRDLRIDYETGSRAALDRQKRNVVKMTQQFLESMDYKTMDITFDELEINTLFVDEAHNYKNIHIDTRMSDIRGINTKGSSKCQGLLHKVRCVQSQNNGRGVVFATGTPLCNSISDAYTMQIYLQYDDLVDRHLDVFDNWVKTFAKPERVAEIDVDTKNYRIVTRFAKFFNLPELSLLFSKIAVFYAMDNSDEIPDFEGYTDCVIEKNKALKKYMLKLASRTDAIRAKEVDRTEDNMLKVSTDGRKAALDLRLVGEDQPAKTSKVTHCVENVWRIYQKYPGCSQLIFCDYSTPKADDFNVYKELMEGLVDKGMRPEEIAFIHSYRTEERKVQLFSNVNNGKVRVLIGSTFKLGIGSNVQTVLKAIHHLDVPWRPADMVQREGRILRRGNTNDDVLIYRYICEGSFDAYSWQILETKQRFISQFLEGSAYQRSSEDLENSVLSFAEVKALALSNENMKKLAEKENELAGVKILSIKYVDSIQGFKEDIIKLRESIRILTRQIDGVRAFLLELETKTTDDFKQLRIHIQNMLQVADLNTPNLKIGDVWGFELYTPETQFMKPTLLLKRNGAVFYVETGDSLSGNALRIANFIKRLGDHISDLKQKRTEHEDRITSIEREIARDNPYLMRIKQLELEVDMLRRLVNEAEFENDFWQEEKQKDNKEKEVINPEYKEYSYFRSCLDFDDVKIRYHELMKANHPDVSDDKEEIAKEINRQYEEIKRKQA